MDVFLNLLTCSEKNIELKQITTGERDNLG